MTRPDAILASNTSSIPIMKIAMATSRPDHVIGMHFFNPAPVLKLLELVPSMMTSEVVESRARSFATDALGKAVIRNRRVRVQRVVRRLRILRIESGLPREIRVHLLT